MFFSLSSLWLKYLCRLCVLCLHCTVLGRDRVSEESASAEDAECDVNISYHTENSDSDLTRQGGGSRDVQEEADKTPEAQWGRGAATR